MKKLPKLQHGDTKQGLTNSVSAVPLKTPSHKESTLPKVTKKKVESIWTDRIRIYVEVLETYVICELQTLAKWLSLDIEKPKKMLAIDIAHKHPKMDAFDTTSGRLEEKAVESTLEHITAELIATTPKHKVTELTHYQLKTITRRRLKEVKASGSLGHLRKEVAKILPTEIHERKERKLTF